MNNLSRNSDAPRRSVLVLGANGRLGQAVCEAFEAAGWTVLAHSRRPIGWIGPNPSRGIEPIGDALDAIETSAAVRAHRISVVVHAMNPPYTRWDRDALPLAQRAAEIAEALGATLLFPGNVYNFGDAMPAVLREDTAQQARHGKGEIRIWIEDLLRQRTNDRLRAIVVRAGDFFGVGTGSWFDKVITARVDQGRITYPGDRSLPHAWAYLPDLARVFVQLAERAGQLPAWSVFNFAGHTLTGDELVAAIERAARRTGRIDTRHRVRVGALPWRLMQLAGWFARMPRELVELRYLWFRPHRLDDRRLRAVLGDANVDALTTPLDEALARTLGQTRPADTSDRAGGEPATMRAELRRS